jgi:hypothetical protein
MPSVVLVDRDGNEHTVSTLLGFQHAVYRSGMRPDTGTIADAVTTLANGGAIPASLQRLLEEFPESTGGGGGSAPTTDVQKESYVPSRLAASALASTFIPIAADAGDTAQTVTKRLNLVDTAGAKGYQINLEHSGNGTGATNGQTIAVDIHNNPGAKTAIVVHQYSNDGPAVRLDNTGTGTTLLLAQTNNATRNPGSESANGGNATGDAVRVVDSTGAVWVKVDGRGSLIMTPPADATQHTIDITGNAANAKRLIKLTNNANAPTLEIVQNAGAVDAYGISVAGKKYAATFTTSDASGSSVRITRSNTTGGGDVLDLRNDSATGRTLLIRQSTTEVATITREGEFEHLTAGKGVLLRSPNGTRYRLSIADGGTVSVVAA